jgi:hypothetical protein
MGRYLDKVRCFAYIQGNCSDVDEGSHAITSSCRIEICLMLFWGVVKRSLAWLDFGLTPGS